MYMSRLNITTSTKNQKKSTKSQFTWVLIADSDREWHELSIKLSLMDSLGCEPHTKDTEYK